MSTSTTPIAITNPEALTDAEIEAMEPYTFLALLGKRVIHPGGKPSTRLIYRYAAIEPEHHVLEVGCGVGHTAIEIAQRYGARVTAIDIDSFMVEQARQNVARANLSDRVKVEQADILSLPFADGAFDRVLIETVTMFVDHTRAVQEVTRTCKSGGRIVDHEFVWKQAPTDSVRNIMEVQLCPSHINTPDEWVALYERNGLSELEQSSGVPTIMSPLGMLRDEGFNVLRIASTVLSRRAYRKKMKHMMGQLGEALPYLGWVVVAGTKS